VLFSGALQILRGINKKNNYKTNNNRFNETHSLDISNSNLIDLLRLAIKDQLFQFDGKLSEQVDGVAMGSPLGPSWLVPSCALHRRS